MEELCGRLIAAGIPLERAAFFVRTLHPDIAGRSLIWRFGQPVELAEARYDLLESEQFLTNPVVWVQRTSDFITRATAGVTDRLPGIRPMAFGHVGDGNIHFNLTQPEGTDTAAYLPRWEEFNDIVHGVVRELHGSISAEHGSAA